MRLLGVGRRQHDSGPFQRVAGGIGVLLQLIQEAKPDPTLLLKEGGDAAWDDVALATETAVQAVSALILF